MDVKRKFPNPRDAATKSVIWSRHKEIQSGHNNSFIHDLGAATYRTMNGRGTVGKIYMALTTVWCS
jgi:hypothetical protein